MTKEVNGIGELIATWRKGAGLTQADLAEAIGVQQAAISKHESNSSRINIDTLLAILGSCGLALHDVADEIELTVAQNAKPIWERIDD